METFAMILIWAQTIITIILMNAKDREFRWNEKHGYVTEKRIESYARLICCSITFNAAWFILSASIATLFEYLFGFCVINWFYSWNSMVINDRISKQRGFSFYKARRIEGRRRE